MQGRMLQDQALDGIRPTIKIHIFRLFLGLHKQIGQHMIASENQFQFSMSQLILSELESHPTLVWIATDTSLTAEERTGLVAEISLHRFRSKILIGVSLRLKESILKMTRHLDKDFYLTQLPPVFLFLSHRR